MLEEGDEDEDDEDDEEKKEDAPQAAVSSLADARVSELQEKVLDIDVPQAFSHYTHFFTRRERLVCDLQGELVLSAEGLRFECTDPCIHNRKTDNRSHHCKTHRTDKGSKGINQFFQTHHCNALCEILGLTNK